ncbi:uncharacterized protein LOC135400525 [Ornithodoros turicata]|uniref:uncharacterized protein LOC135400525 n=1 Tax=Ornithodoros turicata TaxID=34597 RepID=UPI0031395F15
MTERGSVNVKLPKLELLKFDGKRKDRDPFWEQFDRLVHRNEDLPLSDKFSYLKSLLTGDAAAAMGLHVSAECYKDAVELRQKCFGADTAIIQEHMEALLNIRPIQSSGDVHELRKLHDRLRAHMRGLNVLGVAEDSYCSLLYPVLLRSLPKDLVLQYCRKTAVDSTQYGTNSSSINETGDNVDTRTSESTVTNYRKKVADLLQLLGIEVDSRERLASVQKTDNGGHSKGVTHKKQFLPRVSTDIKGKPEDLGLLVADVQSGVAREISVLVGCGYYWEFVSGKVLSLGKRPGATETAFGITSENIVSKFWELESIGVAINSLGDQEGSTDGNVLISFKTTVKKVDNRYEVRLPWKNDVYLDDNEHVAQKRLHHILKKLEKNPEHMLEYDNVVRQYLHNGIAEETDPDTSPSTTKLRVVFDASSHESDARSLNDNLESGPNLNSDLVALLLNFRKYRVALVADIEKAFLQTSINDNDRDALRFLWLQETPTPGHPLPDILLRTSLYVDGLLIGASDEESTDKIYLEANDIFRAASMKLHKWASNSSLMGGRFQSEATGAVPLGEVTGVLKVLGLTWNPTVDTFSSNDVLQFAQQRTDTKRSLLQTPARLYDPMGFLSPFLVKEKIWFQRTWQLKLNWGDALPNDIKQKWHEWCEGLPLLQTTQVPRFYEHGVDAACICVKDATGEATTSLLLAKARVALLKKLTLPRLELMACLIASRLFKYISSHLKLETDEIHFWSDSTIALYWIQGNATRWKPFVQNRVVEIQENGSSHPWHYCPSKENPADLMTRGITAKSLVENELWWKGIQATCGSYINGTRSFGGKQVQLGGSTS